MKKEEWYDKVESGFQILPTSLLGRIRGHDGTNGGVLEDQGVPGSCDFDFSITPVCGWGDAGTAEQKSTGGWLASFAVFEPHWQVTMADARATGRVTWKNRTYDFVDAPFYAEKNWGKALPAKWYWTQCNSFDGYNQPSVTAGGGIRQIPFGQKEALGMVCVHYNGAFYEAVPWTGTMEWKVATWGSWLMTGKSTVGDRPFEVEVTYTCDPDDIPGMVFRAPTPDEGMVYFCRDTFEAKTTLTLWELEWDAGQKQFVRKTGAPLIDRAISSQGGAEVGGGPWWDEWNRESRVKQPIKALLQFPFRLQAIRRRIRSTLS
jgi:tocopherol cyclase